MNDTFDVIVAARVAQQDAVTWAARITERWRASVESIFETGRLLMQAKADLPHGAFAQMCEEKLPFGQRTAQRLMAIAEDKRLSNPTHVSHLPASWGTLSELTKLTDDELKTAFEQKIISPDMIRADVDQIRALSRPQPVLESSSAVEQGAVNARVAGSSPAFPATQSPHVHSPILDSDGEWFCQGCGEVVEMAQAQAAPLPNGARAIMGSRTEPADSLDFFPTPPWATRALIEHVFAHLERKGQCKFQSVWEPACGEGHMAEPLREYFRTVFASDLADYGYGEGGVDFLRATPALRHDFIITNPPFADQTESFVLKAIELAGTGVAMFVRMQWLESIGRYERIFRDKPPTLISFFAERVPLRKGDWNPDGSTATAYIWLVWIKGAEPRAPFWIPPGCRESLSRPDDIKKFGKAIVEGDAA